MKEALFWKTENDYIKCNLCPHNCIIKEGKKGLCNARQNIKNKLYSLVYSNPISINIDPIEKKPLYHFFPLTKTFSIGTIGCNMKCMHCQNFEISQNDGNNISKQNNNLIPSKIVELALNNDCKSISYTYNEPTIFFEYAYDIAKIAKKKGLKNILVTNGFINTKPREKFCKVIDAVNVDLKSFNDEFYKKYCFAKLENVLETLKIYNKHLHLEITYLVIDKLNDNLNEIEKMCIWIKDNLGKNIPIHFSRSYPMYKMQNIIPTPIENLLKIKEIAKKHLEFVYIGNVNIEDNMNIICPKCNKIIVDRNNNSFEQLKNTNITNNKCEFCNYEIYGWF
jgi:pyruvate formate lyase activating enzyme